MTDILLTNARLIDPEAGTDTPGTVRISGGKIAEISPGHPEGAKQKASATVIDCRGKCLAPGIVDIGVKVCEPGERHKESFKSAGLAAAAGGVTTMVTRPDTLPAIDTPEVLEFVTRRAREASPVRIKPMATLTKAREGREMVEIGFLLDAGAVAFTDGDRVTENTKVLSRAMTYARSLNALVIAHPQEPGLSKGAAVTSGKFASLRGLPAVSPMAERMALDRDMALVEMTGVKYHADQISTARALPAFFKVKPPLRSEDDRVAMVQAVASGLIDVISSMHTPQDEESKRLPYEEAASGAVALETLLPAALRLVHSGAIALPALWRALSLNPARRLGLDTGRLAVGAPADLVLFDPDAPFVLDRFKLRSKSKNTPFDGARMQGRVLATFVAGTQVFGEL
jgi:dihydroorotase